MAKRRTNPGVEKLIEDSRMEGAMMKRILLLLMLAFPAFAENKPAVLQTTDQRAISCDFPVTITTVSSVTYTLLAGTDATPSGMEISTSITNGEFDGLTVTNGRALVVLDPDAGAVDRDGNVYEVRIVVTDGTYTYTCVGPLIVEDQEAVV